MTIVKSGGNGLSSSLHYQTSDDTAAAPGDYTATGGDITFSSGQTIGTFTVPIIDDATAENTETIRIGLHNVVNGSVAPHLGEIYITDNDTAPPPPPPPPPPPGPIDPPGSVNNPLVGQSIGVGAPDIATLDHDVMQDLIGGQPIPGSGAPDTVGAFRFICKHTGSRYDDHVAKYQQPGTSHLHDNTGHRGWNASSNYGNLRVSGGSDCNDVEGADRNPVRTTWAANRTSYLQPALLDGKGNVINADLTAFYYKRRPKTDPIVSNPANAQYMGQAVPLPNGIKFIFGNHPENSSLPFDNTMFYMCTVNASISYGSNMLGALAACKGTSGQFEIRAQAPGCWDGVNLDSADHRSHLAYASYGGWGYQKCDAGHPYVIPEFTYAAQYTILATDDITKIHWSSDEMDLTKPQGWSFHIDYGPAAWDPIVLKMWTDNCIDKLLNCSAGDLGNGFRLKGAAQPIYRINGSYVPAWVNPVRLTPVP